MTEQQDGTYQKQVATYKAQLESHRTGTLNRIDYSSHIISDCEARIKLLQETIQLEKESIELDKQALALVERQLKDIHQA